MKRYKATLYITVDETQTRSLEHVKQDCRHLSTELIVDDGQDHIIGAGVDWDTLTEVL